MLIRRKLRTVFLVLGTLVAIATGNARAGHICLVNCDFECPSVPCDQFTIVCNSRVSDNINITQLYLGKSDQPRANTQAFPPADMPPAPPAPQNGEFITVSGNRVTSPPDAAQFIQVSGNGTKSLQVTLNTRLAPNTQDHIPFPPRYFTHAGFFSDSPGLVNTAKIQYSRWSYNGQPVNSDFGHMPGVEFQGTSSVWRIVRITEYDSAGDVDGHEWSEEQASDYSLFGSDVPLNVSIATFVSSTQIPLDALNNDFKDNQGNQYNPTPVQLDGPPQLLPAAVPEPGTLTLLGTGAMSLIVYGWRRRKRIAGRTNALTGSPSVAT
jgi:hypothetical protein